MIPGHGRDDSAGVIPRRPDCICGAQGKMSQKYDAYYCPVSGAWLEEACDTLCSFCVNRPEKAEV